MALSHSADPEEQVAPSAEMGEKWFHHTERNAVRTSIKVLLIHPHLLARLVAYLGAHNTYSLLVLNRQWAQELMRPTVWEILAGVPYQPLLVNCFRRAASYCYRELDVPSPNVNRRGAPPVIRACVLGERTYLRDYVRDLRALCAENQLVQRKPRMFGVADFPLLDKDDNRNGSYFDNAKILRNDLCRTQDTRVLTGSLEHESAHFYLWSLEKQNIRASMYQQGASCFHACNDALAVGCTDGTVKIWDFNGMESRNFDGKPQISAPPTASVSHRTSLSIMAFIRTRSKDRVVAVHIARNDGTFMHLATSTEKGEANVWDVTKGNVIVNISSNRVHKSALPRPKRESNPQVTSMMLFRNTLVCGTSTGFIRVFDLRSGELTHRLAGHPEGVLKTDTKGRVLWSAGKEGSVRWWGGKTAKVLHRSAICDGSISTLEMDENIVVAGYNKLGMEAWDVRTQQPLCSFSNGHHGGVKSLQFDSRKILTVSTTGKAALWRWYSPNPVHWFEPPTPSTLFVSGQYDDRHFIFGTSNGDLLDYDRLWCD